MNLSEALAAGPLLTDGGWATELQSLGLGFDECPDAWNLSHPSKVEQVARSYVEAGSQIVLSNTFRANRISLAGFGLADRVVEINRKGAAISKLAAGGQALVFASIGPSGKSLGNVDVTPEEVLAVFTEQARALAEGGADALVVETMVDLDEATIALRAALTTRLPVVMSFVFDIGKNKDRGMPRFTPERAAAVMEAEGAFAVGGNCGNGIEAFVPLCARLRAATKLPVWIKANAGLPKIVHGKAVYATTPEEFASHVKPLVDAGANFVGGCCGTNPAFIRVAAERLAAIRPRFDMLRTTSDIRPEKSALIAFLKTF
jgi:5-methyltetrahydrofolate--homocysteine methyltransferase